jgi:hypothetical protein
VHHIQVSGYSTRGAGKIESSKAQDEGIEGELGYHKLSLFLCLQQKDDSSLCSLPVF